ncbi:MAG: HRDC domain-containing protein [Mycobacteriaceae bacterium]
MPDIEQGCARQITPLLEPRDGVPEVTCNPTQIRKAARALANGHGPLAVDAERASGFKYSQRAYLIQLRRKGSGTILLDPIPHPEALQPLAEVINALEWVLHSADQDLPGLAELGLHPAALYDTELAGRLAGFERVGLAAIVERTLGLHLAKGHGAADWSIRPLPSNWLNYAALDVEVLLELQSAMNAELTKQGKISWAAEEFEHIRTIKPQAPKPERWRRTSQIHKIKSPRQLAAIRELWLARDTLAQIKDTAPGRVLPDSAIISAALSHPTTTEALLELPIFSGQRQRQQSHIWIAALKKARELPEAELPPITTPLTGPPPVNRWAKRDPVAAARLEAARAALSNLSQELVVPVENLLSPELVRKLCWDWSTTDGPEVVNITSVAERLAAGGARPWQCSLTSAALAQALVSAASKKSYPRAPSNGLES